MSMIQNIIDRIAANYSNDAVSTGVILSVLLMVLVISVYEFMVYRLVSHRSFYNKAFNISIVVLPFFISTIILCLQSNLVITLGTIGALAIIRYRTAVKDPVDMLYILWSIHTGIVCGCRLYEVAVLTSLFVTVVLLILEHLHFGRRPYILVLHSDKGAEDEITALLKSCGGKFRIKSRNYTGSGIDYAVELSVSDPKALTEKIAALDAVERFSLVQYDAEDIL